MSDSSNERQDWKTQYLWCVERQKYTKCKHATTTNVFCPQSETGSLVFLISNYSLAPLKHFSPWWEVLAVWCLLCHSSKTRQQIKEKPLRTSPPPSDTFSRVVKMPLGAFTPNTWINGTLVYTLGKNIPPFLFFYCEIPASRHWTLSRINDL